MVFRDEPSGFTKRFDIVSCYIEHEGEFLLLHRREDKSQGGKWGLPAGKVEKGETNVEGMMREVWEETGLSIDEGSVEYLGTRFIRYPDFDFVFHMYRYGLSERPHIQIQPNEHQAYCWVRPTDAFSLPLMDSLAECIRETHLS